MTPNDAVLAQLKAAQEINKELRDRIALLKFQAWHNRAVLNAIHASKQKA